MQHDIRWIQRFNNYIKAFRELKESVELSKTRELNKLEKQGLIQGFEYTHELSWKVIKDYLEEHGITGLIGSKDSIREAFKIGLISDGDIWMDMIKGRNLSSHTYDSDLAEELYELITKNYYPVFENFTKKFTELLDSEDQ